MSAPTPAQFLMRSSCTSYENFFFRPTSCGNVIDIEWIRYRRSRPKTIVSGTVQRIVAAAAPLSCQKCHSSQPEPVTTGTGAWKLNGGVHSSTAEGAGNIFSRKKLLLQVETPLCPDAGTL
jgi:hypothetical protein